MGQSASLNAIWMVDAVLGQPEDLPHLKDVERVHPQVLRILGQNPGQLTLQGTNTYVVGRGAHRILIDTSDGNVYWWPLLQQVLREEQATITEVILTHGHHDHVGDLELIQSGFPQAAIHKRLRCAKDEALQQGSLTQAFSNGRKRGCACDEEPMGCENLVDGQEFQLGDCILRVLFTPGHSLDSVSLVLEQAGKVEAILTGDTVLGGRTARFSDLMEYNQSLGKLLRITTDSEVMLLPGHGDVVSSDAAEYLQSILSMQTKREKAILRTLQVCPGTAGDLCHEMYGNGSAAAMAHDLVEQHLENLLERGRVIASADFFGRKWWEANLVPAM